MVGALFLNRELVIRGLAWHYKFYSDDKRLADDEDNARLKKLGLWAAVTSRFGREYSPPRT